MVIVIPQADHCPSTGPIRRILRPISDQPPTDCLRLRFGRSSIVEKKGKWQSISTAREINGLRNTVDVVCPSISAYDEAMLKVANAATRPVVTVTAVAANAIQKETVRRTCISPLGNSCGISSCCRHRFQTPCQAPACAVGGNAAIRGSKGCESSREESKP